MKSKKCFLAISAAVLFLTCGNVKAVIVGLGRFDKSIGNADIILKGTVTGVDTSVFEMYCFSLEVNAVLKSDGNDIPARIDLKAPFPVWPEELGIPFRENQTVLLILQRKNGKISVINNHRAILPAIQDKTFYDINEPAERLVFEELRDYISETKDEKQKGLVLVLLSQLGTKEDEKLFLPYLKSENQWLHRAALASLARLNPMPERIQQIVDDFNDYHYPLESYEDYIFWEMYEDIRWESRCGAWGMNKEMTTRARAYLPVYRTLIDKAPVGYQRVYIAIEVLKNIGTREDVARLYKYIDSEKTYIRHEVLIGIARILDLKIEKKPQITSYLMPLPDGVDEWEEKTRSVIEQAIKGRMQ